MVSEDMHLKLRQCIGRDLVDTFNISLVSITIMVALATQTTSAPLPSIELGATSLCPSDDVLDYVFLRPFASLRHIDLSNCGITNVKPDAFKEMHNLVSVSLSDNDIETLHADTFVSCSNLHSLDLSGNPRLVIRDNEPLLKSSNLRNLSLRNCGIQSLSRTNFQNLPSILALDIHDNPVCDVVNCESYQELLIDNWSSISNAEDGFRERKTGRMLLKSEMESQWSSEGGSTQQVRFTSFVIVAVGSALALSIVGVVYTKRGNQIVQRNGYKVIDFEPTEIVVPQRNNDTNIRHRTSYREKIELIYVLLRYTAEYPVYSIKI